MDSESEVLRRHARSFSILVAIVILTTGCAKTEVGIPATNTETPSPPTSTASPTYMPTQTPTQAPTPIPFDDKGPWLMGYGSGDLTLYDLSGNKRLLWNSLPSGILRTTFDWKQVCPVKVGWLSGRRAIATLPQISQSASSGPLWTNPCETSHCSPVILLLVSRVPVRERMEGGETTTSIRWS